MSHLYQEAMCLEPLDADVDKNGVKSDHRIVLVKPINTINNKCGRQTKTVKYRPFPEAGFVKMKNWFIDENWQEVYQAVTAHDKAEKFQNLLISKLDEFFPQKTRKIQSDDQPWMTQKLKKMDRTRRRLFRKERKSEKWNNCNKMFKKEVKNAKSSFYKKSVAELKTKKPGQWYQSLKKLPPLTSKRMSSQMWQKLATCQISSRRK